jgi:predicted DNA-binding transcriptional regulator AlpA
VAAVPEPDELPRDWWTVADVARYLGVKDSTVRTYVSRGDMPPPDRRMGQRVNLWKPQTIIRWNAKRPRKGKRPFG